MDPMEKKDFWAKYIFFSGLYFLKIFKIKNIAIFVLALAKNGQSIFFVRTKKLYF